MAKAKKIQVEVFVNESWEAGYSMSRENLDKVYRYMDLLQSEESGETDVKHITDDINYEHERIPAHQPNPALSSASLIAT